MKHPSSTPPADASIAPHSKAAKTAHSQAHGAAEPTSADGGPLNHAARPDPERWAESKRKRVTRACDNCRLRKVKCDGRQPCIHCTVYSYNCTYDRPNVRNKKPAAPLPSVMQSTSLLQSLAMNKKPSLFTLNDNLMMSQNVFNLLFPQLKLNLLDDAAPQFDYARFQKVVAQLSAKSPGAVTIQDISDSYLNGNHSPAPHGADHLNTNSSEEGTEVEIKISLPPKNTALQLIYTTWNKACVLFRFYHRPSLLEEVDLLYSMDPSHYTDRQQKFLPFMYTLLACGSLFSKTSQNTNASNDSLEDDGFNYFLEARKLIDISNVCDIPSIQTIVLMTIYLQCSARLSTCYSYIGIALRSALKEGLHRDLGVFSSRRKLDPIEIDTRKRLFYTIYKMDIYINSLLGLPGSINEDEFDQTLPIELDDELITRDAFLVDQQQGRLSSSACANHHTKLTMLLSRVVKELYPIKVKQKVNPPVAAKNIHDTVTEFEIELKKWMDDVPAELRPSNPSMPSSNNQVPERFKLANYYLHIAFLNCQISLYRPFIHFISNGCQAKNPDPRSLIRGRNCIKVARLVVKLANKMIDENLLVGTYWFSMYTIFFSIACLVYYFHYANYNDQEGKLRGVNYAGVYFDDDLNIDMIRNDIEIGKKVLDNMKDTSTASLRIYNILNKLFEQLNRKTATSMKQNPGYDSDTFWNDSMVKLSISNFDEINQFGGDKGEFSYGDMAEMADSADAQNLGFLAGLPNIDESASGEISLTPAGAARQPSPQYGNFHAHGAPHIPSEPASSASAPTLERPIADENSMFDELIDPSIEYLPGMIDTLDTQMFGRLLPPYMLRGNPSAGEFPMGEPSPELERGSMADMPDSGSGAGGATIDPF